jgi:hypothetical protein
LASTSIGVGPAFARIVAESATATGGSSTHGTLTVTVAVDPPFSV